MKKNHMMMAMSFYRMIANPAVCPTSEILREIHIVENLPTSERLARPIEPILAGTTIELLTRPKFLGQGQRG
jgi:hypothetical protein